MRKNGLIQSAEKPRSWPVKSASSSCIEASTSFLKAAFAASGSVDRVAVENVSISTLMAVREDGLAKWLNLIRAHHDGTYQHCLLVNGIAARFCQSLRLSQQDSVKLCNAAVVHDIGKADVPPALLDMARSLTSSEFEVVMRHPVTAFERLTQDGVWDADILDAVRHHHEALDGSGYPDGLGGSQIADLSRLLTIADIFAALIEKRSYKEPLSNAAAYARMWGMEGKLDLDLLRAFRPVIVAAAEGL